MMTKESNTKRQQTLKKQHRKKISYFRAIGKLQVIMEGSEENETEKVQITEVQGDVARILARPP